MTALGVRDWQVAAPSPVRVVADSQRLTQAITQLAANAVKYTDADDTIRIGATARDGMAMVWVEDSGPGVSPEDAERIFERFYRAKDPRVGKITGTGLGLTLAREVVRLHGGDISVDSQLNQGSTFTLTLPVIAEAA